jgi:hypothetical protein
LTAGPSQIFFAYKRINHFSGDTISRTITAGYPAATESGEYTIAQIEYCECGHPFHPGHLFDLDREEKGQKCHNDKGNGLEKVLVVSKIFLLASRYTQLVEAFTVIKNLNLPYRRRTQFLVWVNCPLFNLMK